MSTTALVQASAQGVIASGSPTTGITTTSGDTLAVGIAIFNGSNAISSFVDSKSNIWTLTPNSPSIIGASTVQIAVYTAKNINGGSGHTFTVTNTNSGDGYAIYIAECSGCDSTSPLRIDAINSSATDTQSQAGATVAAGAGDIVLFFSSDDIRASDAFTAGSGLTIPTNGSLLTTQPGFIQYAANVSAGSKVGAYTTSQFTAYCQVGIALKAAVASSTSMMLMGVGK